MARFSRRWPGRVIGPQRQALAVPVAPATPRLIEPQVTTLVDEISARRHIQSRVISSRWPGYQWVGLPPVRPLIEPVTVDQSPFRAERRPQTRGGIIQPRPAALAAPVAPSVPRLLEPLLQTLVPENAPRRHPGSVISPRSAVYAATASPPPVVPRLIQPITVEARPARQQRHGDVVAPRPVFAPVAPTPRPVMVGQAVARRVEAPRLRGAVCQPRTRTAPVSPPRPVIMRGAQPPAHRRRRTGILAQHGRFQQTTTSAAVYRSLVAHPPAGDTAGPITGDRGQTAAGYSAAARTGDSAQPPGSGSGTVNL